MLIKSSCRVLRACQGVKVDVGGGQAMGWRLHASILAGLGDGLMSLQLQQPPESPPDLHPHSPKNYSTPVPTDLIFCIWLRRAQTQQHGCRQYADDHAK